MSSLTLKNVPPELLEALREDAARQHRSLNRHALALLTDGVRDAPGPDLDPKRAAEREARLAVWESLAGRWQADLDLAGELRGLRRARTRGRRVVF